MQIQVKEERELESVARELLKFSGSCRIICFMGEMGAGKTTFIRYLCKELGVDETVVSSPTFSLVKSNTGQICFGPVYHLIYRIYPWQGKLWT